MPTPEIFRKLYELRFKVIGAKNCYNDKKPIYRDYAVSYFLAMDKAWMEYGSDGVSTQILYILSNLEDWDCECCAKPVKTELEKIRKIFTFEA